MKLDGTHTTRKGQKEGSAARLEQMTSSTPPTTSSGVIASSLLRILTAQPWTKSACVTRTRAMAM
jgi:hypothetical protein